MVWDRARDAITALRPSAIPTTRNILIAWSTHLWQLSVTMRPVTLTLYVTLALPGCSALEPGDRDNYVLARVQSNDLPATIVDETLPDGRVHRVRVTAGELTFFTRGTFETSIASRSEWPNAPADTLVKTQRSGAFVMLGDTAVQVRFRQMGGSSRTTYRILEGGDLLRAIDVIAGTTLVYDYRRR